MGGLQRANCLMIGNTLECDSTVIQKMLGITGSNVRQHRECIVLNRQLLLHGPVRDTQVQQDERDDSP